jgi:predicted RNase H-like HicB family nuclease
MTIHHGYRGYVFSVTYLAQEPAYSVSFPGLPEIITSGSSLPGALANACEALDLHLESLQKLGKRLPKPRQKLVVESA